MFKYSTDVPYINTVVLKKISGQLILLKTWIFRFKKKNQQNSVGCNVLNKLD